MNIKHILVPTDFSEASRAALEYAAVLARNSGAELLLVHVRETGPVYATGDNFYHSGAKPELGMLRKSLEAIRPNVPVSCIRYRMLDGNPADAIVDLANAEHVGLIVMATHGRTGLPLLLMGSVADAVMRRATCPVLTLKPPLLAGAEVGHVGTGAMTETLVSGCDCISRV
ncbi:MAG TPA: universal stress protein [Pirellulales bacterium]|jgi:nucleotide-binding universal stress UspA family protein|nr:universal stress protein [Pirellulales bacterium]